MAKPTIPKEIQRKVQQCVHKFNSKGRTNYQVSFRGKYCYLSRIDKNKEAPFLVQTAKKLGLPTGMINQAPELETKIGRLTWNGSLDDWDFAVFRYSNERYDPDAVFFMPGEEFLDGTIEGAMKAGFKIYP